MKAAGAAGLLASMPSNTELLAADPPSSTASVKTEILRLNLKHTWTTTMSASTYRDTLHLRYARDGITGYGEGAPIVRYHENAETAKQAVDSVAQLLAAADPMQFDKVLAEVFRRIPGEWAGKAAVDIALMDWVGKKLGVPLYRYFGLDPKDAPVTTFSIGTDTPEITRPKVREAAARIRAYRCVALPRAPRRTLEHACGAPGRAPCIHARLRRLATKPGEKSGLRRRLSRHAWPNVGRDRELQLLNERGKEEGDIPLFRIPP